MSEKKIVSKDNNTMKKNSWFKNLPDVGVIKKASEKPIIIPNKNKNKV